MVIVLLASPGAKVRLPARAPVKSAGLVEPCVVV
jgi:hypothetical protein